MTNSNICKGLVSMAATAVLMLQAAAVSAHDVPGRSGEYVRDRAGDCVHDRSWSKEVAAEECHPELFKKAEPEVQAEEKPAAVTPPPQPTYETITLSSDLLFDFDSTQIKPEARDELHRLAERIKELQEKKDAEITEVRFIGHTDSVGPEEYNQQLSVRRAQAVKDYVVKEFGADPGRIMVSGEGESNPVADNSTREGRAKNRRVEVIIGIKEKVMK